MKRSAKHFSPKSSVVIVAGIIGAVLVGYGIVSALYWANYRPNAERNRAEIRRELSENAPNDLAARERQYDRLRTLLDETCQTAGVVAWQRTLQSIETIYERCMKERDTSTITVRLYKATIDHQKAEAHYAKAIREASETAKRHSGSDSAQQRQLWATARQSIAGYRSPDTQEATRNALLQAIDGIVAVWDAGKKGADAGQLAAAYDRLAGIRLRVEEPRLQVEERFQSARKQLLSS